MTFRLTDDFAIDVKRYLSRAYDILEAEALNTKTLPPPVKDITAIAMVRTMAEMIEANIGNDKERKREAVREDAIKSV